MLLLATVACGEPHGRGEVTLTYVWVHCRCFWMHARIAAVRVAPSVLSAGIHMNEKDTDRAVMMQFKITLWAVWYHWRVRSHQLDVLMVQLR